MGTANNQSLHECQTHIELSGFIANEYLANELLTNLKKVVMHSTTCSLVNKIPFPEGIQVLQTFRSIQTYSE
jgi:hypothetical protein